MFTPENKLEEAILKSYNDPSYTPEFYRVLLDSEILFIIAGENSNRGEIFHPGDEVTISHIEFEGISWLPIFSSLKLFQEFTKVDCAYGKLVARNFFKGCKSNHVILDPNLEKSWRFTPQMVQGLVDGSIFQPQSTITITKPTTIEMRVPPVPPQELIKALSALFSKNKNIQAAYLVEVRNPAANESAHPFIGIETDCNYDTIVGDAGLVALRISKNRYLVDFMQLKRTDLLRGSESHVGRYLLEEIKPFYKKKKIGGIF
jgi:hypothetical protein